MTKPIEVTLEFGDRGSSGATVTKLENGHYRVEDDPLGCLFADDENEVKNFPKYQDIIEADQISEGVLRFKKVVKRSRIRSYNFVVAKDFFSSPQFEQFKEDIENEGGYWDQAFGGVLIVRLPVKSKYPNDW